MAVPDSNTSTKKKRELFDAKEYTKKLDEMIVKLRATTPGELTGAVGKNEILEARREALQSLVNDGYTIQQIAEAMKNDVFGILPKTITEIVNNKPKKERSAKVTKSPKAPKESAKKPVDVVKNNQQTKQPPPVAGAPVRVSI